MSAKKTTKMAAAKKSSAKQTVKTSPKAKKAKPEGNMSAVAAAARVLIEAGEPLTTQQMIEAMATKGYWTSPGWATPHATLYSALLSEINAKGKDARFVKVERGQFAAKK